MIVTRMVDTTSDRPVVIAAGLTQYGTLGAGELLADPQYFSEVARRLPRNWPKKNLQIVLSPCGEPYFRPPAGPRYSRVARPQLFVS
jgi:hypothetical protein